MKKIQKRGLSTIVATVLIILITIIAIISIAQFAIPFVRNNLQRSTECTNYQNYYKFDESFSLNCYEQQGSSYVTKLSIRRDNEENLNSNIAGFNVVLINDDSSKPLEFRETSLPSSVLKLSTSTLNLPKPGESLSYSFNPSSSTIYTKAEVYPVLKNGRICSISDKINLIKC